MTDSPAEYSEEEWDRRVTLIRQRVKTALGNGCRVVYSAYEEDESGLPIDNLDEIAVDGRCRFIQSHDPFWGEGQDYQSEVVVNPTWNVARLANEMIRVTGDEQHVLEGITVLHEDSGAKKVEFDMGS